MATNTTPEPLAKREPARLIGALVSLSAAIFVALPLVGYQVAAGLPDAIEGVITAGGAVIAIGLPIVQAEITRRRVVPVATANAALEDQARLMPSAPVKQFQVGG